MAEDGATVSVRVPSKDLDTISSLPDVILQHILSFLLTESAIRTSILSKRWRHVWYGTPSIFLPKKCGLTPDSINKTLACLTARKIRKFHLHIGNSVSVPYIDTWIKLAMSRNVENLSLQVSKYDIPEFFYSNSVVSKLRVELYFFDMIPKCSVSWTSLKKLYLKRLKLSDESIAKILTGCPILKSLTMYYCEGVMVLDLSKSPRLKIFKTNRKYPRVPRLIVAPHIHRLVLKNSLLPCTLVDVSSLKEAELDIFVHSVYLARANYVQTKVLDMLEKLQNVEKLTLGENFLKILSLVEHRCVQFPSFTVKALTLETTISQYVIPGIVRLLQNSPRLKILTLEYTKNPNSIQGGDIDKYLDDHDCDSAQFLNSEARVFKDIFLDGEVEPKHVASFIELMLKTKNTLEKMVVSLNDHLTQGGLEELLELLRLTQPSGISIRVTN